MVGRNDGELVGQYIKDLFPPEDVPWLLSRIALGRIQGQDRFEFYLPQVAGERLRSGHRRAATWRSRWARVFDRHFHRYYGAEESAEMDLRRTNLLLEKARARHGRRSSSGSTMSQQSLAPRSLTWASAAVETYYQAARTIGGDFGLVTPGGDYPNASGLRCLRGHGIGPALVANRIYTETISLIEGGAAAHADAAQSKSSCLCTTWWIPSCTSRWPPHGRVATAARWKFSSAGHPPAMLFRPGQMPRFLESASTILGCFEDAVSQDSSVNLALESGDRVMLYTDGFTDNFDSQCKNARRCGPCPDRTRRVSFATPHDEATNSRRCGGVAQRSCSR